MKANTQPIRSSLDVPFSQAYWVRPALMMAGCYPGAQDHAQAHRQLKGLVESWVEAE